MLAERVSFYSFHIEHIRSMKHGGTNELNNLAYCCPGCNYYKGSDVGTFLHESENLILFFNPRKDSWDEHSELEDGAIHGKTDMGKATGKIFKFNEIERLIFRQQLAELNLYP
ncbi:HNH endonuclease [Spirosoma telluris]|uniref:HNH endonuclease n=1 Tax=Spirosoma telluris TaxID=2183553 RepID=UPI0012FB2BE9